MISNDRADLEVTMTREPVATGKTILVADPEPSSARRLSTALRRRGYRVLSVRDGSKALQVAVLRAPDLVLYDLESPFLKARVFAEILKANPRTSSVPIVFIGDEESSEDLRSDFRCVQLRRPYNIDDVLARMSLLLRRVEAEETVRRSNAVEGSLEHISLPDILQMLAMNRRSGLLMVTGQREELGLSMQAEILLSEGKITDARLGEIAGEKALFRALGWERGTFSFSPSVAQPKGRLQVSVDEILLEGLRQKDELGSMDGHVPCRDDMLAVVVGEEHIPDGLHPVTREVMSLLSYYRTCGEVLDHARASDLDAMRAIRTLIDRGLVTVLGRSSEEHPGRALVSTEVLFALQGHLVTITGGHDARPRVVVAAPKPSHLAGLAVAMTAVAGWRPDSGPRLLDLGFGNLGEVRMSESVRLVLTALPADDGLSPLWRPFSAGALGAVILYGQPLEGLVRQLLRDGLPVALTGPEAEISVPAFDGRVSTAPDFVEALSSLLVRAARYRAA